MSKRTQIQDVIYKKEVTIGINCDVCKKDITGKYWILTTHHDDWGNDSIDSFEHYDLCSKECINEKLNEYYDECRDSITQCFDLRQDIFIKK